MIRFAPISQKAAREWVKRVHRHLDYPTGDRFRTSVADDTEILAVGVAGTPSARMLNDGVSLEVTRIAAEAAVEDNCCTRLYGALQRTAINLGYSRVITYTRLDELGTSVKAANFIDCGLTDGGEWDRPGRKRKAAAQPERKRRWIWPRAAAEEFLKRATTRGAR